jgi:hypothetical protein
MKFNELRMIVVKDKIEKKNNLSYLSWAWAVDTLLQHDPAASWEYKPHQTWNDTVMVFCKVKAFGVSRTAQLPVMNHRNQPIANPDAFQVNTAMQRCLAKAIALHGIGLHIYAGEDLPEGAESVEPIAESVEPVAESASDHLTKLAKATSIEDLKQIFAAAYKASRNDPDYIKQLEDVKDKRKKELTEVKK